MLKEGLKSCLGAELNLLGENLYSLRYCLLSKKGNLLEIDGKKVVKGSLVEIMEILPKNYPIALSFTGKGIIHKNLVFESSVSEIRAFQMAFPSIDQKEFYFQEFEQNSHFLISIMRRISADDILEKLKLSGFRIYSLSLGAAVSTQVWAQLNIYGTLIHFDGHEFALCENKSFLNYSFQTGNKNDFPVKVEKEILAEELIISYAAAFQLLLHDKLIKIVANVPSINQAFTTYTGNEKLKGKVSIFLFALFISLLISFIGFSYYNQENSRLNQQVGALTSTADEADILKNNIAENQRILKALNWNSGYNYGFILNEIGSSTPKQLSLKEIGLNDYKSDLEKKDRISSVKVTGSTSNLAAVNNWIFLLKAKPWVKSVRLLRYEQGSESDAYQFNLLINY